MTTLANAFPAALAEDVAVVASLMPPSQPATNWSTWSVEVAGSTLIESLRAAASPEWPRLTPR